MIDKIKDIRLALQSGAYLSALALSLTLPDICSQVENGKEKGSRSMYIN